MYVGIVTCFNRANVNYGNRLQAYALNFYLKREFGFNVETLNINLEKDFYIKTKKGDFFRRASRKIHRVVNGEKFYPALDRRRLLFNEFCDNNITIRDINSVDELASCKFDIMISGSDVVWHQEVGVYRPIMFLDFELKDRFKKISYAASFGADYIPESNRSYIQKALEEFSAISCREQSSLELLKSMGISDAIHTVDPTLLVSTSQWHMIEERVEFNNIKNDFIFVYLLGNSKKDRDAISAIADYMGLPIVTVPFARGWNNSVDLGFGDEQIMNCKIEQWLWLIENCMFVVTDSFHGIIFSTIFNKPFIAVDRLEFGINNRIKDFLNNICQLDKFVNLSSLDTFESMDWDYKQINEYLEKLKENSRKFLETNCSS